MSGRLRRGPVVMVGEDTYENIEGDRASNFADLLVKET